MNYDFGGRRGEIGCDLRTRTLDHSSARILLDRSYVVDPSGKKRHIAVTWDYRATPKERCPYYRMTFKLDDEGNPFATGIYAIHLELEESGVVYAYDGRWRIKIGADSPLRGQMKTPEGSWRDEREESGNTPENMN